jgi:hypothetical protein
MFMKRNQMLLLLGSVVFSGHVMAKNIPNNQSISEAEIVAAQKAWCQALVDIGQAYKQGGLATAQRKAEQSIDAAYAYQQGPVLFKPTLTVQPNTFRTSREGALSYFVGGNTAFPEDTGFALQGWTSCVADNSAIRIAGNTANTMGKVRLSNAQGQITTVDKTWGYIKDPQGSLRIVLHHSSLEHTNP